MHWFYEGGLVPGQLALSGVLFSSLKLMLEPEHEAPFYLLWSQLFFKDEKFMGE